MSEPSTADHPRCIHLCCKSMLVYGEGFENDPDYQSGQADFWCLLTSRAYGPDGDEASMALCRNPERTCYREY